MIDLLIWTVVVGAIIVWLVVAMLHPQKWIDREKKVWRWFWK